MKSKVITGLILLSLVISLTACSQSGEDKTSKNTNSQTEETNKTKKEEESENTTDQQNQEKEGQSADQQTESLESQPSREQSADTAAIQVYYSNADATAFESAEVQIASLSPEAVLEALVSKGALTADVQENFFTIKMVDDKESIELDLNKAFATYISNMGSTGEYYVVGALCNTFLNAYECEQIRITVDGEVLSTGHAEYPGYLAKFE